MATIKGKFVTLVVLALVSLAVGSAFPNGINPPRPAGSFEINAICTYKINNNQAEVFRTKVKYGDITKKSLYIKIGKDTEEIGISDISLITSIGNSIDADGFTKAKVIRAGDTEKENVKLKVKSNDSNIKFVGFDKDGGKESINLLDCKSLSFSSSHTSQNEEYRPVMKK